MCFPLKYKSNYPGPTIFPLIQLAAAHMFTETAGGGSNPVVPMTRMRDPYEVPGFSLVQP